MRTSFHHQPEAQHPNFQLSTRWSADYPIFRGQSGGHSDGHGPEALRDGGRPSRGFREGAARVQRPADAAAAVGAIPADNAATTANPTKGKRIGRLSWRPRSTA